ncbi:MAG: neutral zinc metallopeptidase [Planctomycetota bacterium]
MRLDNIEESRNVEDRRRMGGGAVVAGGGGLFAIIIAVVFTLLRGGDVQQAVGVAVEQAQQQAAVAQAQGAKAGPPPSPEEEAQKVFASKVLTLTEEVWTDLLPKEIGRQYQKPRLVFFTGSVKSACGTASSAVGPFYCPGDSQAYLDLSFFNDMATKFKAEGDFACAYVIAHEIGHHIQNLLGLSMEVQSRQARMRDKAEANQLSVRLELQADFLAGVWAHHAQRRFQVLERGDIGEALRAANAIGDDTLQRNATGTVRPDAFTHGTSEQRIYWFRRGLETGSLEELNLPFEVAYNQL